ncbi:MAG: CPBP family intramembrane metalloprotease [bacterium]|nr:CPBP family intramembrane metalloprotease [bacterium]
MLRWFDIAVLSYLAILLPLIAVVGYRRMVRRLAAGDEAVRLRTYSQTIVLEWVTVVILLAVWLGAGRGLPELGFGFDNGWRFWLGTGLALVATILLFIQAATVTSNPESLESVRRRMGHLEQLVPHTERELKTFRVLSVTAGICEEIVYRGYAIWAVAAFGGIWWALIGSTVLFSLGHLYQGPRSLASVSLVGLVMAGLFVLTGALWAPMILHAAIDLNSGRTTYEATKTGDRV